MTSTHRTTRVLTGLSTVLIASLALTGAASAEPEHAEAIQLSWDGENYTATTAGSFFGDPVVVPGDAGSRTLHVRNDGPTPGTLRASIINVELLDPDAPDVHHNPDHRDQGSPYGGAGDQGNIYDDLRVTWADGAASFTELSANGSTEILQISLEEGEQAPITLAYDFVHEATSGNRANVDPRSASFDVLIEIGGDLPDEVPKEAPPPPPSDDTPGATPPGLPSTGTTGLLALIAAAAVVGGLLLRYASQQRQRAVHVTTGLPR